MKKTFLWLTVGCVLVALAGCHSNRKRIKEASGSGLPRLQIRARQPGVASPVAVRAIIRKSDGTILSGEWMDPPWPPVQMRGKAMGPDTIIDLPVGLTEITIGKGPDYYPQTIITNLTEPDKIHVIDVDLVPVLNLYSNGWRGGDLHVHYNHGDAEISRTPMEALNFCAAGGFNFGSFCQDHYGAGVLTRQQMLDTWVPFERSECKFWLGVEEPKSAWGHHVGLLYDPWQVRSALPYSWGIEAAHRQGGVIIPVHPERLFPGRYWTSGTNKNYRLYPLNNHYKAYPISALTGHLIDGWSGVSDEAHTEILLGSYFKLLQMGYRIPLIADSDVCMDRVNNETKAPGSFMTYYRMKDEPLTRGSLATAIRNGRVMCTTGPLVSFAIDNAQSGDTLNPGPTPRTVRIEAAYEFNQWSLSRSNFNNSQPCRVTEITLFRNGEVFRSWRPNVGRTNIQLTITENTPGSYYMVRVTGNDNKYMAGYASPIYFDARPRPRQPEVFKSVVQGRLYDAFSGGPQTGTVSSVRYGMTNWTIATDAEGRFQAKVPIDAELIARDGAGRELRQNLLRQESVYSFASAMSDNFVGKKPQSINAFISLVETMRWEFPMGYQSSGSYVKGATGVLAGFERLQITNFPAALPGETRTEIAMLLMDKTQVSPGDTIRYAALFRNPAGVYPTEELSIEIRAWHPIYPRMYGKYGTTIQYNNATRGHVELGNEFYLRHGSVIVPAWVTNATETTAGLRMFVTVRQNGIREDANLLLPIGPTRNELLVSSTWDGMPAAWGETGLGPCNFYREFGFEARYPDYRTLALELPLEGGGSITISPELDNAYAPDADDALFTDTFYYDGQCAPEHRDIPFRTPHRLQPVNDFVDVPLQDPPDSTAPRVVAMEPLDGTVVPAGRVAFYYFVDDHGLSGPSGATIWLNGQRLARDTTDNPVVAQLQPGNYSWQVEAFDQAGNHSMSEVRSFQVIESLTPKSSRKGGKMELTWPANTRGFTLQSTPSLREPWQDVTRLGSTSNGVNRVTLDSDTGSAFFRLQR